jgi:hypothetical protein
VLDYGYAASCSDIYLHAQGRGSEGTIAQARVKVVVP